MNRIEEVFRGIGYCLEACVASDCFGDIYLGKYVSHNLDVLLRVMPEGILGDSRAGELALSQVEIWSRLSHGGILRVLDWGKVEGFTFFATEKPRGKPLFEFLRERSEVSLERLDFSLNVLCSLLEALEAARRWGVLHLTLSLNNIWIEENCEVQASDFGLWYLSRDFPEIFPAESPFLSPEQKNGEASAASDVYSAALVFVALGCGLEASSGVKNFHEMPEVPSGLREVFLISLDENPRARFISAGDFLRNLGGTVSLRESEYEFCPFCELKARIEDERLLKSENRASSARVLLPWILILALAAAALAMWLAAL
ncbi:MAG: protein kinase [Actinomycetota bacterium]|nr:protein kinase [Actinomycetota bacterium]